MPWQALREEDLELGASASLAGIDAGLVWADATRFVDLTRAGEATSRAGLLPAIVELLDTPGAARRLNDELSPQGSVPSIYLDTERAGRYCTALLPRRFVKNWLADLGRPRRAVGSMIARLELQMPVIPQRARVEPLSTVRPATEPRPASNKAVLIGVIDSGCPFAHRDLRDASGTGTRVLGLWDQNDSSGLAVAGGRPRDLGYGCEVTRRQLNELMRVATQDGVVCEETCYHRAGYREVFLRMTHGAAVLGLLAGAVPFSLRSPTDPDEPPRWTPVAHEAASDADIAFVQLPRDAVQDSSSAGLARLLLDGLRYIISLAGPATRQIVINISNGSSRGTHDGASIFEKALQEILDSDKRVRVVLAAGNSFNEQRHAVLGPKGAPAGPLRFRLLSGCESPAFVVVRIPQEGLKYRLCVTPPGANAPTVRVAAGEAKVWPDRNLPGCTVVFPRAKRGENAHCALIAWRPTAIDTPGPAPELAGEWTINVEPAPAANTVFHFYISRNQVNPGALRRSLQSWFVDADERYDPDRPLRRDREDRLPPASPIRRKGSLSSLATLTAAGVTVVGAYLKREGEASLDSSDGPAGGGSRMGPDRFAPADESFALPGINVAGSRSGDTVRVRGTSFAAPQIARLLADRAASKPDAGLRPFDVASLRKPPRKPPREPD